MVFLPFQVFFNPQNLPINQPINSNLRIPNPDSQPALINFPRSSVYCDKKEDITKYANAAGGGNGKQEPGPLESGDDDDNKLRNDKERAKHFDSEDVMDAEATPLHPAAHDART